MNIKLAAVFLILGVGTYVYNTRAEITENGQVPKLYIQSVKNSTGADCALGNARIPAKKAVRLNHPIEIPYVSIRKYLREYALRMVFTPDEALKIMTPQGLYRLWSSESGVMCARDPKDIKVSFDTWKAKTLFSTNEQQLMGKKIYLGLVLAALKKNKVKISLEPVYV